MAHAHPSANFSHHETRLPSDGWSSSGEPLTENTSNQLTPHHIQRWKDGTRTERKERELMKKKVWLQPGIWCDRADRTKSSLTAWTQLLFNDRQIRLWGVEAQNRMRKKLRFLMINLRGISTEACKNNRPGWSTARSPFWDPNDVSPEDFRRWYMFCSVWEVAQKKSEQFETLESTSLDSRTTLKSKIDEDGFLASFDIVCLTDSSSSVIVKSPTNHVTPKRVKKVSPLLWASLALFELQSRHNINYPEGDEHASELINIFRQASWKPVESINHFYHRTC
ncbi:hypothetical protein PGT21_000113 [Puccinia graminis f. sp. tritici]|uniref:Uncharacterized protein n=1 Tax=Puccinia graminis f. sp. tritici TaxID=56615 RepID=A0A5B0PP70_PUCGR|nr:hypothetical protein PGT21_000113 [Puccinia graminis f. sp. tritici]